MLPTSHSAATHITTLPPLPQDVLRRQHHQAKARRQKAGQDTNDEFGHTAPDERVLRASAGHAQLEYRREGE